MSTLASQLAGKAVALNVGMAANTETILLDAIDVQRFDRFTIYVVNSGAQSIQTLVLQTAPTTDGPWITVDATISGGPVNAGDSAHESYSDKSFKYIKILGTSQAGTTVSVYLSVGGLN